MFLQTNVRWYVGTGNQHWFEEWLGTSRRQAISQSKDDTDLCCMDAAYEESESRQHMPIIIPSRKRLGAMLELVHFLKQCRGVKKLHTFESHNFSYFSSNNKIIKIIWQAILFHLKNSAYVHKLNTAVARSLHIHHYYVLIMIQYIITSLCITQTYSISSWRLPTSQSSQCSLACQ